MNTLTVEVRMHMVVKGPWAPARSTRAQQWERVQELAGVRVTMAVAG